MANTVISTARMHGEAARKEFGRYGTGRNELPDSTGYGVSEIGKLFPACSQARPMHVMFLVPRLGLGTRSIS